MTLTKKETGKNRLCIYAFYDKDGIMDEYVFYYLISIQKFCSNILCVVNGGLKDEYIARLHNMGISVYLRENLGFDAMAYKYGLSRIDNLEAYDELIISNNSFFGPIYPLDEMFSKMDSCSNNSSTSTSDTTSTRDTICISNTTNHHFNNINNQSNVNEDQLGSVAKSSGKVFDFWGMSVHPQMNRKILPIQEYSYINEHVQTFFVVFTKKVFLSEAFRDFWENLRTPNSFLEAVCLFELRLTSYLSKHGFTYGGYLDSSYYGNHNASILFPYDTLIHDRCPFIKRKVFTEDYKNFFEVGEGQQARYALEVIKNNTDYDVNLIWNHLLRTTKFSDLRMNLQLNYAFDSELTSDARVEVIAQTKIALLLYIYYEDAIEECLDYAVNMPKHSDIYFVSSNEQVLLKLKNLTNIGYKELNKYNKIEYIQKVNKGRDLATYLIDCKDVFEKYDYVCFFHDKRSPHLGGFIPVRNFFKHCMDSLLPSEEYVINLIWKFEQEKKLGMIVPPPINYDNGFFYASEYNMHPKNKEWIKKLINELDLQVPFDDFPVAPYGDMFWVRGKVMANLFNKKQWTYNDLPDEPIPAEGTILHALERLLPMVVQSSKYFVAWGTSEQTARTEITNLYHIDKSLNKILLNKYGMISMKNLMERIKISDVVFRKKLVQKKYKYLFVNIFTLFLVSKFKKRLKEINLQIHKM